MSISENFPLALKQYRNDSGLSQEEVASRSKLDRSYISELERGEKIPTLSTIEKLAVCFEIDPLELLHRRRRTSQAVDPDNYFITPESHITARVNGRDSSVPIECILSGVSFAHEFMDSFYSEDLDIASVLGLRNLSAFVGEVFARGVMKSSKGLLRTNPHQDGYPDLLLMDSIGSAAWRELGDRLREKAPFSPFAEGGIEVKATCGAVPSPQKCREKGFDKPSLGDTRINLMQSYDWKAHHRETNNLIGLLWDFIDGRPRIVAVFFSNKLQESDWGNIVQPKQGGGRTTSVSIMNTFGRLKMYEGWICVIGNPVYSQFLNKKNRHNLIPA